MKLTIKILDKVFEKDGQHGYIIDDTRYILSKDQYTGDFASGSELIVWGSDSSNGIANPNLQDGTLFEETDTNKHYIWNSSTSTWTEVT